MRLAVFLSCAGLLVPAAVAAQPADRTARTHFESGRSYYDQARYADALREFEEALRLASEERKPLLHFNIGQTQERLGRLEEAIASFRRYLEMQPQANDRPTVEARIQSLQGRLDATTIALRVNEDGASVLVDGAVSGTTPLEGGLRVSPGAHEIRVEKEGFQPFSLRVTVPAGEEVGATATLVPLVAGGGAEPAAGGSQPSGDAEEASGGRFFTWIAAGVAGAAAIGGGVLGALALGKRDDANAAATGERTEYDAARSDAESLALFADIAFGVAVLAAGTAVVLFFVEGGAPEQEEAAAPRARPLMRAGEGAGFALAWDL